MATKDAFMRRGFRIGVEGAPLIKLTALEVLAHTILPNRISKKLVIKAMAPRTSSVQLGSGSCVRIRCVAEAEKMEAEVFLLKISSLLLPHNVF